MWDTLGWGGETQALIYNPKTKKVIGINALGVAPTGATRSSTSRRATTIRPSSARSPRSRPGTPGGLHGDAGRVRHAVARAGARAGDRDGRRLRDRSAGRRTRSSARRPRSRSGSTRRASSCRTSGRRAKRPRPARSSGRRISRRRCASSSRPKQTALKAGQVAQGGDPRRVRSLLQGRHRAGDRARHARGGRPVHDGGSGELAGEDRRAALDELQGHRGLQARAVAAGAGDAAGAQHPRERRREGDGLQHARSTSTRSIRR